MERDMNLEKQHSEIGTGGQRVKTDCVWANARKWCNRKNGCKKCSMENPHECKFCGECPYLYEDGTIMKCGLYNESVRKRVEDTK